MVTPHDYCTDANFGSGFQSLNRSDFPLIEFMARGHEVPLRSSDGLLWNTQMVSFDGVFSGGLTADFVYVKNDVSLVIDTTGSRFSKVEHERIFLSKKRALNQKGDEKRSMFHT